MAKNCQKIIGGSTLILKEIGQLAEIHLPLQFSDLQVKTPLFKMNLKISVSQHEVWEVDADTKTSAG